MTLRQLGSFFEVWTFYVTPRPNIIVYVTPNCISLSNSRLLTLRYIWLTSLKEIQTQFLSNYPRLFVPQYSQSSTINAEIKTNLATIHRHVNIFLNTSYVTLQQVKDSIEIVFRSQLTLKDDNVDIKSIFFNTHSTRTI
jgi:hypothetical protein